MERKCVAEWRMYLAITEKKIAKLEHEINRKPYIVTTNKEYELNKAKFDAEMEEVKTKFESLSKLKENHRKVKAAIQKYNATHEIEVCGKSMTVAAALELWINRHDTQSKVDSYFKVYEQMEREIKIKYNAYEAEESRVLDTLLTGNRTASEGEKKQAKERCAYLEPKTIDPLGLKKYYEEKNAELIEMMETINTKINIANAVTEIEIEL